MDAPAPTRARGGGGSDTSSGSIPSDWTIPSDFTSGDGEVLGFSDGVSTGGDGERADSCNRQRATAIFAVLAVAIACAIACMFYPGPAPIDIPCSAPAAPAAPEPSSSAVVPSLSAEDPLYEVAAAFSALHTAAEARQEVARTTVRPPAVAAALREVDGLITEASQKRRTRVEWRSCNDDDYSDYTSYTSVPYLTLTKRERSVLSELLAKRGYTIIPDPRGWSWRLEWIDQDADDLNSRMDKITAAMIAAAGS